MSQRTVTLNDVRLSFASLDKPKAFPGSDQDPKYQGSFLIAKDDPQVKAIAAAEREVIQEQWGAKATDVFRKRLSRRALRDAGEKDQYNGYDAEHYYMQCNANSKPTIVDGKRRPLEPGNPKFPYSGCYVNARVTIWAQDNQWGKAINVELNGVQFRRDGESFGGGKGASAVDEFDMLEDEDDAGAEDGWSEEAEEEFDPLS